MVAPWRKGNCIDCGRPHERTHQSWRCWECLRTVGRIRQAVAKVIVMAMKRGILVPARQLVCVDCGAPAHDHDHRDYSQPLKVEPVCRSCNQKRGPAAWNAETLGAIAAANLLLKEQRRRQRLSAAAAASSRSAAIRRATSGVSTNHPVCPASAAGAIGRMATRACTTHGLSAAGTALKLTSTPTAACIGVGANALHMGGLLPGACDCKCASSRGVVNGQFVGA